jgi:hypothetical protein
MVLPLLALLALPLDRGFLNRNCAGCHNAQVKQGGLDLAALSEVDAASLPRWVRVHDRLSAGEMPPAAIRIRPDAAATQGFLRTLTAHINSAEAAESRAWDRRLNRMEYENALRDLLHAPWLQLKGQFPEDAEAYRFNKSAKALDVSHIHLARYLSAADFALRQAMSVRFNRPPTSTIRYYAREQAELVNKINHSNQRGDRATYPILGWTPEPEIFAKKAPFTVGAKDPTRRDQEAVAWVSSNYVTGFRYRWDRFRAPVAGRYRVRFSGYTIWVPPLADRRHLPDFEKVTRGRNDEPVAVYTRNGVLNRRVGEFDLTPEPGVHDVGAVWLNAGETLVPDATRLYRSRPTNFRNPLMTPEGAPGVAFRWMEVDGPLSDASATAGYELLFGDLPLQASATGVTIPAIGRPKDEVKVDVVSPRPREDAERLVRGFMRRAYRRPPAEIEVQRIVRLIEGQRTAGLSFAEAMLAGYTAVLSSPGFVFVNERPGPLDEMALATRLSLFLSNSLPDDALRARAARGELRKPAILRAETERLLNQPQARRFIDAFLDYWLDLRKIEDSTPSPTLYNDYYLDDALTEASVAESQLYFAEMIRANLGPRFIIDSPFTFLNGRLARHYGVAGVEGVAMRKVDLPPGSARGGFLTQASVLKVTANGTTTSPVLRGKFILERILGAEVPPPPPVAAVEPDIRGAVTIRQQLDKHRVDPSCASCHAKIDPPGFALEGFDVMGGWRERYRAFDESKAGMPGFGKNGQPFQFHYGLPVDSAGKLSDGRPFADIVEFKRLLAGSDDILVRNLANQLIVFATGAPVRFSDRAALSAILAKAKAEGGGVRSLIHAIVASSLFQTK